MATTTAKSSRGTECWRWLALREGRPHRAQGALAYHVLDTMIAIAESVESRAFVDVELGRQARTTTRGLELLARTVWIRALSDSYVDVGC